MPPGRAKLPAVIRQRLGLPRANASDASSYCACARRDSVGQCSQRAWCSPPPPPLPPSFPPMLAAIIHESFFGLDHESAACVSLRERALR
jgi:hypothetical protein